MHTIFTGTVSQTALDADGLMINMTDKLTDLIREENSLGM